MGFLSEYEAITTFGEATREKQKQKLVTWMHDTEIKTIIAASKVFCSDITNVKFYADTQEKQWADFYAQASITVTKGNITNFANVLVKRQEQLMNREVEFCKEIVKHAGIVWDF